MKKNPLLEDMLERNEVVLSTGPIDALSARRHFHSLIHEVETTGRSYHLAVNGRLVATLQAPIETSTVHV